MQRCSGFALVKMLMSGVMGLQQVGATHVEAKVVTIKTEEEIMEENFKVAEEVLQRLAKGRVVPL